MELIPILQIVVPFLLIGSILLQQRGGGMSSVFGGGGGGYYFQKRGMEKSLFWFTIILSVLFFGLSIVSFLRE